jgi:hypothetical protein
MNHFNFIQEFHKQQLCSIRVYVVLGPSSWLILLTIFVFGPAIVFLDQIYSFLIPHTLSQHHSVTNQYRHPLL